MNLFILDKNYNKIGLLSNQGANPIAPFFDDMYTQELDTGADTYEFSTVSTYLTQELMEIGNHIIFEFNNEHKLFVIADIEFSHKNGMNTINVYCEGIGFELLEKYVDKFEVEGNFNNLLGIILVGTGWKHEVGSKVTAIKKMKYDGEKNILAIIQDGIKEYDGVEVKFEVDYSESIIKKKVRVYENGGRGSHIGYRFEYGQNVNGITKKEQIADSKDDTVVFVNDNEIGILLEYDVDVAMRSEEIAQLEIGDTHYVIDHDFIPPITLEARVGKLEISFSDPTKNKVTLTNFKHANGSISQKTHKGNVSDIASDITKDAIDEYSNHTHPLPEHTHPELAGSASSSDDLLKSPRMHSYEFLLYTNTQDVPNSTAGVRVTDCDCVDWAAASNGTFTNKQIHDYLMYEADVWDVSYLALDQLRRNKTGISGATNRCFRLVPNLGGKVSTLTGSKHCLVCNSGGYGDTDYMRECELYNEVSSRIFSDIMGKDDRPSFNINGLNPISNNHFDKHMLDLGSLTCGLVSALQYHIKTVHGYSTSSSSGSGGTSGGGDSSSSINGIPIEYITNGSNADLDFGDNGNFSNRITDGSWVQINESLVVTKALCGAGGFYSTWGRINELTVASIKFTDGTVMNTSPTNSAATVSDLSEYATVEELQEEIRTRDEEIANLKARLERIEAMLGIDDNK